MRAGEQWSTTYKPSIKRYESLICNMQEIPSKKRKTKRIEILQNLYNLSRPYPRKHSSLVSKKASA